MPIRAIQAVNVEMANRYYGGDFTQWSGLELAGAMCGEAGDAANVAAKLRRMDLASAGNDRERRLSTFSLRAELARECAEVFLSLLLLASRHDIDLQDAVETTFNRKSGAMGFPERITLDAVTAGHAAG